MQVFFPSMDTDDGSSFSLIVEMVQDSSSVSASISVLNVTTYTAVFPKTSFIFQDAR